MKIVEESGIDWGGALPHRDSGVLFKDLLIGADGPDNYLLALVKIEDSYQTPRHRHNFDQVRFMLKGGFGFGEQIQEEGSIGYFGEGTIYEQKSMGPNVHLLLQCANASRSAYFGRDTLRRGNHELQQLGKFEKGLFVRSDRNGKVHRKDGFEAVWEHLAGEPVQYQQPRYTRPVIFFPDRFAGIPLPDAPGVKLASLGSFSERRLSLAMLRVDAGSEAKIGNHQRTLFYTLSGHGLVGERGIETGSAIALDADETSQIRAMSDLELIEIRLPI